MRKRFCNVFLLFVTSKNVLLISTLLLLLLLRLDGLDAEVLHFPLCTSISSLPPIVPSDPLALNEFIQQLKLDDDPIGNAERRIAVLPNIGATADLLLTTNNHITSTNNNTIDNKDKHDVSSEFSTEFTHVPFTTCGIRLEACVNCIIRLEIKPATNYFTDTQIEEISNCDSLNAAWKPCFSLMIIEERADRSISVQSPINIEHNLNKKNFIHYRGVSNWNFRNGGIFNSTSSSLLIIAILKNIRQDTQLLSYIDELFPIKIVAQENKQIIYGSSLANATNNVFMDGFIKSPRFPDAYPKNLIKNYTLINVDPNGFIRLVFDDFHIHYLSELKIIDSNGLELFNTRMDHRRPPALVSTGNSLTILFLAHGFTQSIGFSAHYEFVDTYHWQMKPNSKNCDDYFENYGGQIAFNKPGLLNTEIDCIWLISYYPIDESLRNYQIYLKVKKFQLYGNFIKLEVRRGSTSLSERVLLLNDAHSATQLNLKQPTEGYLTKFTGNNELATFYVRLRGFLTANEGLSIVYSIFYRWEICSSDDEFRCDNSRCINNSLRCDGYDHCGDNSDEICHLSQKIMDGSSLNIPKMLTIAVGSVSTLLVLIMIIALTSAAARSQLLTFRFSTIPFFPRRRNFTSQSGNSLNNEPTFTSAGEIIYPPTTNICQHYRRNFLQHVRGMNTNGNDVQIASSSRTLSTRLNDETLVMSTPSIQTVGERRFYFLPPDHQISIIEAPPTYTDALKHPTVPIDQYHQYGVYDNLAYRNSLPEIISASNQSQTNEQSMQMLTEEESASGSNLDESFTTNHGDNAQNNFTILSTSMPDIIGCQQQQQQQQNVDDYDNRSIYSVNSNNDSLTQRVFDNGTGIIASSIGTTSQQRQIISTIAYPIRTPNRENQSNSIAVVASDESAFHSLPCSSRTEFDFKQPKRSDSLK